MADLNFLTPEGQTIDRELLIAYLNTGSSSSPSWSPLGTRVNESGEELDWQEETATDILGATRTRLSKPQISQSFEPFNPDAGDAAIVKIWNLAVKDHDAAALSAQDVLIVHFYAGTSSTTTTYFAERYPASAIRPTGLGGAGGGAIEMPVQINYGGTRSVGTATKGSDGAITFTAA